MATWLESNRLEAGRGGRLRTRPARNLEESSRSGKSEIQGQSWGEAGALAWAHEQTHAIANTLPDDNFQLFISQSLIKHFGYAGHCSNSLQP